MGNDINMENSIFNKRWQCITKYSEFDKLVIKLFLSEVITYGMGEKEILEKISNIL